MDRKFLQYVEHLEPKFTKLLAMHPVTIESLPKEMPSVGIYLFSESGRHLYVGRSNRLRLRLQSHCRPGAKRHAATFAFRMACIKVGKAKATYKEGTSRAKLEGNPQFADIFRRAKERVRRMDIRFVEEIVPIRQALLEIYISVML